MTRFRKSAGRGYVTAAEPVNACWSYLSSCEWRISTGDALRALVLLAALIPITPFVYLCVAPLAALIEGTREDGE